MISRAEQLPGLTWQSTRSVIVVCCCLLTSVTALGDCHTIAALIFPCVRLLTLAFGLRDDPWQLRDGQVSAEFLKWQLHSQWIFFFYYCFPQQSYVWKEINIIGLLSWLTLSHRILIPAKIFHISYFISKKFHHWCPLSLSFVRDNLPLRWFLWCSDKNPLKTNKNTPMLSVPSFPSLSCTDRKSIPGSEYVNMQMKCKVSLQRKRFHMQGFEWVSVILCQYPLPRGKWVRRPGLDGLWLASPGRRRSEERALLLWLLWWRRGEDREKINKGGHGQTDPCLHDLVVGNLYQIRLIMLTDLCRIEN